MYHDEAYAVMAVLARNPEMKKLTRTARAIPFLIMALLGYVCTLVSVYFGWGWPATQTVLVLTGIAGGAAFFFLGALSAIGSVVEAKKKDVNQEKLWVANRALSCVFNSLDMDSDLKDLSISDKELVAKLLRKLESAKKALGTARDEIHAVDNDE